MQKREAAYGPKSKLIRSVRNVRKVDMFGRSISNTTKARLAAAGA